MNPQVSTQGISTLFDLRRWRDVIAHGSPLLPDAQDAVLYVQVIHAHWALDEFDAALTLIGQGRSRWPTEAGFNYYAALIYLSLGLIKKAEREVDDGLRLRPQWSQLHAFKARTWFCQQDLPQALLAINQALALEPNDGINHFLQAAILWDCGNAAAARASLARALELEPNNSNFLALQADFASNKSRLQATELLRRSLAIDPQNAARQKTLRALTTLWVVDGVLAVCGVVLTVAAPWLHLGDGQGWFIVLANLVIGVRLTAPARRPLLWVFCLLNGAALGLDNKVGLPALWREQGPSALWSLETLVYILGACVFGFLILVGISLAKMVVWASCVHMYILSKEVWQAWRGGWLGGYILDLLLRRGVQFNLAAAAVTMLCVVPPMEVAMSMLLLVFALPIVVWALGRWLLPAGARPLPSIIFMLLGFTLMLATFIFSTTAVFKAHGHAAQWLWTLCVGLYVLCVAVNLHKAFHDRT